MPTLEMLLYESSLYKFYTHTHTILYCIRPLHVYPKLKVVVTERYSRYLLLG